MTEFKTLAIVVACSIACLTGCGGNSDGPPPSFTTQISSDPAFDGDIQLTPDGSYLVTQRMSPTVQSVFAGIDSAGTESRAFLDFHLGGAVGVPGNAIIDSAFLDIFINSLQPGTASLPIRVELVSFQPPTLLGTDYDRTQQPPLAFVLAAPDFNRSDVGTNASIDVTALMERAQNLGLVDFQIRIMEDLGPAITGLLEINDSTASDRGQYAPQLTVTYF